MKRIPGLVKSRARFLSLAQSKLRLCSANHRSRYWSNLPCDWPRTAWAYSEHETENRPWWSKESGHDIDLVHADYSMKYTHVLNIPKMFSSPPPKKNSFKIQLASLCVIMIANTANCLSYLCTAICRCQYTFPWCKNLYFDWNFNLSLNQWWPKTMTHIWVTKPGGSVRGPFYAF